MFVLGLTGSIASGKSTVLGFFSELGIPTYSADRAVHELYEGEAVAAVDRLFPGVAVNGRIDREKLSARLLDEPERLAALETLVHPLVRKKTLEFLENTRRSGADLAVVEIPLLFETKNSYPLDAVAVAHCTPEEQRRRALARSGMTVEKLEAILARQMPAAEKAERADFVIDTSTSLEQTRRQVEDLVRTCRARETKRKT